jgi:hypothetical protein
VRWQHGRASRIATTLLVALLLLHTVLPNSLERLLLTSTYGGGDYQAALVLAALFALVTAIPTVTPAIGAFGLLYCLAIAAPTMFDAGNWTAQDNAVPSLQYLLPLAGLAVARSLFATPNAARLLILGVWAIIASQGLLALVNSYFPFLQGLALVESGETFREGVASYRFGSTAAAANTSASLLALALPAAYQMLSEKRSRRWLVILTVVAIVGFQSRAAILILALTLIACVPSATLSRFLGVGALVGISLVLVSSIRDVGDLSGSNAFRFALALEAFDLFESSNVLQQLFGSGAGAAWDRSLSGYYGDPELPPQALLTASESALIVIIVETGLVGLGFILGAMLSQGSQRMLLLFPLLLFWVFDPSFIRPYECMLATILLALGSRAQSPSSAGPGFARGSELLQGRHRPC